MFWVVEAFKDGGHPNFIFLCFVTFLLTHSSDCLPPENQLNDLQVKPHHLPSPFEEVHNSIAPSGREVDPYPPQVNHSASMARENSATAASPNAEPFMQDLQESSMLTAETLEPAHVYESVRNKSSIVPRKGVNDPKPSVVARKGVGDIEASTVSDTDIIKQVLISSESPNSMSAVKISPEVTTFRSTTQFGSQDRPLNDIQKPPVKLATTEKIINQSELKPVPVGSTTPILKASTKAPNNVTKHIAHSKPKAAVDLNPNGNFSTSLLVGIMFGVLLIIVLAILGYKKLQDIWTKRHYDRMDYLVDGMYDL